MKITISFLRLVRMKTKVAYSVLRNKDFFYVILNVFLLNTVKKNNVCNYGKIKFVIVFKCYNDIEF